MENNFKTQLPDGIKWPADDRYKWFAVDADGKGWFYHHVPLPFDDGFWEPDYASRPWIFAGIFTELASDWQNTLIERHSNG